MRTTCILLFVSMLAVVKTKAQLFQNIIGKNNAVELGESISQAADSSYLVAGDFSLSSGTETQQFIMRLRKNGTIAWSKKVNVPDQAIFIKSSYAEAVQTASGTPDGYIMLVTEITYFYVVRFNNSGSVVWARQFSGADNIIPKIKPSYNLTGTLTGFIILSRNYFNPNYHGVIMKISTTGSTLWQKRITSSTTGAEYRFADIRATTDGGCIAAGNLYQNNNVSSPVLFRFSSTGTVLWRYSYVFNGGILKVEGVAVTPTGFAATGYDTDGNNATFSVNLSGGINWMYRYSNGAPLFQSVAGKAIAADASGNLIIACSPQSSQNAAVFKLNTAGNVVFARRVNAAADLHDVKVTNNNTYCVAGIAEAGNDENIFTANISSTGTIKSGCQPESFSLTLTPPVLRLAGTPAYGIVDETFNNTAINLAASNIQTEQSVCGAALDVLATEVNNDLLRIANDMPGQRILIKWETSKADTRAYKAILYNNTGTAISTIILKANQDAYISMQKMQPGIYSVELRQGPEPIKRGKVIWFK